MYQQMPAHKVVKCLKQKNTPKLPMYFWRISMGIKISCVFCFNAESVKIYYVPVPETADYPMLLLDKLYCILYFVIFFPKYVLYRLIEFDKIFVIRV